LDVDFERWLLVNFSPELNLREVLSGVVIVARLPLLCERTSRGDGGTIVSWPRPERVRSLFSI
jgi:hypothetical protein